MSELSASEPDPDSEDDTPVATKDDLDPTTTVSGNDKGTIAEDKGWSTQTLLHCISYIP